MKIMKVVSLQGQYDLWLHEFVNDESWLFVDNYGTNNYVKIS